MLKNQEYTGDFMSFVEVAKVSDVKPGKGKTVKVNGQQILALL